MNKKKKMIALIFSIITLCTIVLWSFYTGFLRFNYPSRKEFPIHGLDISHHQGKIDWDTLMNQPFQFIYIKATEGGDWVDPKFKQFWEMAQKRKIPTGAYHFYRNCKTGLEQAKNFIATVPKKANTLPPVIDLEYIGNCNTNKTKKQLISEISNYITIIKNHYGKSPLIYSTQEFYKNHLINHFITTDIWIRNIYTQPKLPDHKKWLIWQYSNRGRIKGIENYVDLNVFNGNQEQFKRFMGLSDE